MPGIKMSSILLVLCLLSVVGSVDLRASQRGTRNDDFRIEELFQNKDDEWKADLDITYDSSESRIPRIWKTVQDSSDHYNPCNFKLRQWKTSEYLNLKQYDIQPDEIVVKHCIGGAANKVVKQGCRNIMDCVTQYERRKFIRKPKGASCQQWTVFEDDIPVGCECMVAT